MENHAIRTALVMCRGQFARPPGVSREAEQAAIDRGYLRFNECPLGHYKVTEAGNVFLADFASYDAGG